MSDFRTQFQAAATALDKAFGERLEIRRAAAGEFMKLPAVASNPPAILVGILDIPTEIIRLKGDSDGAKSDLVAERPTAEFRQQLFSDLLPAPAKGDEIIAIERDGSPHYRVLDIKPDGVSHIVCQLAPL